MIKCDRCLEEYEDIESVRGDPEDGYWCFSCISDNNYAELAAEREVDENDDETAE